MSDLFFVVALLAPIVFVTFWVGHFFGWRQRDKMARSDSKIVEVLDEIISGKRADGE